MNRKKKYQILKIELQPNVYFLVINSDENDNITRRYNTHIKLHFVGIIYCNIRNIIVNCNNIYLYCILYTIIYQV